MKEDEVSHLWLNANTADREARHAKLLRRSRMATLCATYGASAGQPAQSALAAGILFTGPGAPELN